MDSTDPEFQRLIGIILTKAVEAMIQSVFYGIFVALIIFSTRTLVLKQSKTTANIVMLAITLCMFVNSSTVWALDLADMVEAITTIQMIDPASSPESMSKKSSHPRNALYEVTELMLALNLVLSDCVVGYWACVLWQGKRRIKIVFFIFLLINGLAVLVMFSGCTVDLIKGDVFCVDMLFVGLGISLSTNVVATSLIGTTAWRHRRFITDKLGRNSRRTQVEKILLILVESSLLYCLASVMLIASQAMYLPRSVDSSSRLMWPTSTHVAGIYPTVILLLISLKRTIWDALSISPQVTLSGIRYASVDVTEDTEDRQCRLSTSC